ncbi:MAG: HNH endonuclease [Firmicutes bacterium]|nr:HNH endonuclease [Bacillota bacterium]
MSTHRNYTGKENLWTDDEWVLSLGYYFFNKETVLKHSNLSAFTKRLNFFTGKHRTVDSIALRMGNYQSVDPEYLGKGLANGGKSLMNYWKKYIIDDSSQSALAKRYCDFINGISDAQTGFIVGGNQSEGATRSFTSTVVNFYRSPAVKQKTLLRSKGFCELCKNAAPFVTFGGDQYLEVHHIVSLAHGGLDDCTNTVALCPNCHRKVHYSELSASEKSEINRVVRNGGE